jgi:DNA-binding GntR family transcriptional regulator
MSKKQTISEQVYHIIKEQIISGYYHDKQKLTETGMANALDVSPTPIREAFKKLESEGFIINRPYKGVLIRSYTKREVKLAYLIRSKVEGVALRIIMESKEEDLMKNFDMIVESSLKNDDLHPFIRFLPFHDWIILSIKTDIIIDVLKSINAVININRLMHKLGRLEEERIIERQKRLYELIQCHETDKAVDLLETMILHVLEIYLRKEE